MAYIKIDSEGGITAASKTHHCGEGEISVNIPDEIDIEMIHEYRYENGEFIYDPKPVLPEEETNDDNDRITALENKLASFEMAYEQGVNEA